MKTILNALERKILGAIQHGMPLSRRPYQELSQKIGITVDRLLETIGKWRAEGRIRRIGAIVNHFQMGHGAGAMVVWNVPEGKIDQVGELFASFSWVSHAYLRPTNPQWPYNLYTMVHAAGDEELHKSIETMSQDGKMTEFRILKTVRELKKVPPTYIIEQ